MRSIENKLDFKRVCVHRLEIASIPTVLAQPERRVLPHACGQRVFDRPANQRAGSTNHRAFQKSKTLFECSQSTLGFIISNAPRTCECVGKHVSRPLTRARAKKMISKGTSQVVPHPSTNPS